MIDIEKIELDPTFVRMKPDQACPKCGRIYQVRLMDKGEQKLVKIRRDKVQLLIATCELILCVSECGYYEAFLPLDFLDNMAGKKK